MVHLRAGDMIPFRERPFPHHTLIFPVELNSYSDTVLYFRIRTEGSHDYPVRILTRETLHQNDRTEMLFHGVYYGIITILAIYNLILYFMVYDRSFLYYFFYITGFGFLLLIFDGLAFEFLWPDSVWWQNRSITVTIGWTFFWSLAFSADFLNIKNISVKTYRIIRILMAAMVSLSVLSFFLPYYYTINAAAFLVISFSVLIFIAAIFSLMHGYVYAGYFLIAWVTFLGSVIVYSLKGMGIFPSNIFSAYSLQIGSAVEMSLLSLGLGSRMRNLYLEKETALRHSAESRRLLQEQELRSAVLELELLKKNIEPHFLMNSLNATVFLFREDHKAAVSLLENLAAELRIMISVSGRSLIPLNDEIGLCRHHLNVMGFRREADFSLVVAGETEGLLIPPLILHTLVENGIRHGFHEMNKGEFRLSVTVNGEETECILENNGSRQSASESGGLGFRFVKARLEEAFPGSWLFESYASERGWVNRIKYRGGISRAYSDSGR